jgi:hypothetical protein
MIGNLRQLIILFEAVRLSLLTGKKSGTNQTGLTMKIRVDGEYLAANSLFRTTHLFDHCLLAQSQLFLPI